MIPEIISISESYFPHLADDASIERVLRCWSNFGEHTAAFAGELVSLCDELDSDEWRWSMSTFGPMDAFQNLAILTATAISTPSPAYSVIGFEKENVEDPPPNSEIILHCEDDWLKRTLTTQKLTLGCGFALGGWLMPKSQLKACFDRRKYGYPFIVAPEARICFCTSYDWDAAEFFCKTNDQLLKLSAFIQSKDRK